MCGRLVRLVHIGNCSFSEKRDSLVHPCHDIALHVILLEVLDLLVLRRLLDLDSLLRHGLRWLRDFRTYLLLQVFEVLALHLSFKPI